MPANDPQLGPIPDPPSLDASRQALLRRDLLTHAEQTLTPKPRRRNRIVTAAAAIAIAVAAATFVTLDEPAAAGITIEQTNNTITATVTDPFEDTDRLNQTFTDAGLDITIDLLPASPSRVGSIVAIQDSSNDELLPLVDGPCQTNDCPIGLQIPTDYNGTATVTFARPANTGETYVVSASAFDPGEPLAEQQDLRDAPANQAARRFASLGLTIEWRTVINDESVTVDEDQLANYQLTAATSLAPETILVWLDPN